MKRGPLDTVEMVPTNRDPYCLRRPCHVAGFGPATASTTSGRRSSQTSNAPISTSSPMANGFTRSTVCGKSRNVAASDRSTT